MVRVTAADDDIRAGRCRRGMARVTSHTKRRKMLRVGAGCKRG